MINDNIVGTNSLNKGAKSVMIYDDNVQFYSF